MSLEARYLITGLTPVNLSWYVVFLVGDFPQIDADCCDLGALCGWRCCQYRD